MMCVKYLCTDITYCILMKNIIEKSLENETNIDYNMLVRQILRYICFKPDVRPLN